MSRRVKMDGDVEAARLVILSLTTASFFVLIFCKDAALYFCSLGSHQFFSRSWCLHA
jgi:hypothetical protein